MQGYYYLHFSDRLVDGGERVEESSDDATKSIYEIIADSENLLSMLDMKLYPNPASATNPLKISYELEEMSDVVVRVYTAYGVKVKALDSKIGYNEIILNEFNRTTVGKSVAKIEVLINNSIVKEEILTFID